MARYSKLWKMKSSFEQDLPRIDMNTQQLSRFTKNCQELSRIVGMLGFEDLG